MEVLAIVSRHATAFSLSIKRSALLCAGVQEMTMEIALSRFPWSRSALMRTKSQFATGRIDRVANCLTHIVAVRVVVVAGSDGRIEGLSPLPYPVEAW